VSVRGRRGWRATLVALVGLGLACGRKSPPGPAPTGPAATITITSAGANPRHVEITLGDRVRFQNLDTSTHAMYSDPHPDHTDCAFLNQVGYLVPGQSRETENSVQARACGFHDHDDPDNQMLRGTVVTK
jgi:hypothetical protein